MFCRRITWVVAVAVLGLPRHRVISRFHSLLVAAGIDDHGGNGKG
jgi:hypothetical protein